MKNYIGAGFCGYKRFVPEYGNIINNVLWKYKASVFLCRCGLALKDT
jgi:hypothetical protein